MLCIGQRVLVSCEPHTILFLESHMCMLKGEEGKYIHLSSSQEYIHYKKYMYYSQM